MKSTTNEKHKPTKLDREKKKISNAAAFKGNSTNRKIISKRIRMLKLEIWYAVGENQMKNLTQNEKTNLRK